MQLVWSFWYRGSSGMFAARMHKREVGKYVVRTWYDQDSKLICTGWFKK